MFVSYSFRIYIVILSDAAIIQKNQRDYHSNFVVNKFLRRKILQRKKNYFKALFQNYNLLIIYTAEIK